jgi:hypothetical protein
MLRRRAGRGRLAREIESLAVKDPFRQPAFAKQASDQRTRATSCDTVSPAIAG